MHKTLILSQICSLTCITHLLQVNMNRDSTNLSHFSLDLKSFQRYFSLGNSIISKVAKVHGLEFCLKSTYLEQWEWEEGMGEQRRQGNNYLSLMLHRSMCKSLKFPREPCWTEMRSLGWLSIKMSLMQPWKASIGFKHWGAVRLSGQPVGQRTKMKNTEMISHCSGDLSIWRPWGLIIVVLFHSQKCTQFSCKS